MFSSVFLNSTVRCFCRCLEQVVNTTSNEISGVAIEASVWDLEGTCPYFEVFEKLSLPPKQTSSIAEMEYPTYKNSKPVYFLLLKLYEVSNFGIISRNFYWLHQSNGDYKKLEPYRKSNIPIQVTSEVNIKGSTYEVRMNVQNNSKNAESSRLTYKNNFINRQDQGDLDSNSLLLENKEQTNEKSSTGFFSKIWRRTSIENNGPRLVETDGNDVGVAFFLHFEVHDSKAEDEGGDTRILPVHYSDNYFSLVPGEAMSINLSFDAPLGVTPKITLHGWNLSQSFTVC